MLDSAIRKTPPSAPRGLPFPLSRTGLRIGLEGGGGVGRVVEVEVATSSIGLS